MLNSKFSTFTKLSVLPKVSEFKTRNYGYTNVTNKPERKKNPAKKKKPTRKLHIWFFPTLKNSTLKKPKEHFFCQRFPKIQKTFVHLTHLVKTNKKTT